MISRFNWKNSQVEQMGVHNKQHHILYVGSTYLDSIKII